MTYVQLKVVAQFVCWIYVKEGGQNVAIGELWRIRHVSIPDERYVYDYRKNIVTRIGEY